MNEENTHRNTEQPCSSMQKSFSAVHAATGFAGNVRATLSDRRFRDADNDTYYPELLSTNTYYPFGMGISSLSVQGGYRFGFGGHEKDNEWGLAKYDYGFRIYNPGIAKFLSDDPLSHEREWLSPYNFCSLDPINRVDPDGALDDGYQDMDENYKWFDDETADVIGRDDKLWVKVTDDRNIFDMAAAGILDNLPEATDPRQITEADNLTSFEMWLDSPSESLGEGVGKIGANIGYGLVNAPYSLLTGQTIGGTKLTSPEKMDAFVDFVPGLITGGLTKTGQVVKTTKNGLQGFNQFVKRTPGITTTEGLPAGMKWQQRAGQLFRINKVNQQGVKTFDAGLKTITVGTKTKEELEK